MTALNATEITWQIQSKKLLMEFVTEYYRQVNRQAESNAFYGCYHLRLSDLLRTKYGALL